MTSLPILFCAGTDPGAVLIERYGLDYSHVATLLPGGQYVLDSRSDVIQGIKAGVQVRPVSYLSEYHGQVHRFDIPCSEEQLAGVYARLNTQIGQPYDKLGIMAFADEFFTGQVPDRNWRDKSAWFCDELCIWSWEEEGVIPRLTVTPNRLNPGHAALIAETKGAVVSPWIQPA